MGFSSVECEINNTHLEKNEEVDGYKNKALTILCQFFKQSPIIFLNSGKACLENIKFKFFVIF